MGNMARDVLFRMPARDVIRYTLFKVTIIDEIDARTSRIFFSPRHPMRKIEPPYIKHTVQPAALMTGY